MTTLQKTFWLLGDSRHRHSVCLQARQLCNLHRISRYNRILLYMILLCLRPQSWGQVWMIKWYLWFSAVENDPPKTVRANKVYIQIMKESKSINEAERCHKVEVKNKKITSSSPLSGGDSVYDKLALVSTSFLDKLWTLTSFPCNRPRYPFALRSSNDRISVNTRVFSLSFFRKAAESSARDMILTV